jgi:glutamate--cysteine ligase
MSNPGDADATPITSTQQLADYIAAGCKPRDRVRIGTEHEKFGFRRADLLPPPYAPQGEPGIRDMLRGLAGYQGRLIMDQGSPIGLKQNGASISLEPGGQLELSGGQLVTLHESRAELETHLDQVRAVGGGLGLGFSPLGFHPTQSRADMPWMPKSRYAVMRRYMPKVGRLGLDMMLRTCTVQVNLDFESEPDMVRKLRLALALQPLATALFANSPFVEGRPNGFQSYRAEVWTDTDPDRTGMPAVMFEAGFGFERYVEWLLDVPMYFVYRQGRYIDIAGASFRDFMAGRIPEVAGQPATIGDFADHMTTVFTDVRLKRYLEMRGADAGSPAMMLALAAFWVGLLYDEAALAAAAARVGPHERADLLALRRDVPRRGLNAEWRRESLRELARDVIVIAAEGLRTRRFHDAHNRDETVYLEPLHVIANGGKTQASRWLERFHGAWHGDVAKIFGESAV